MKRHLATFIVVLALMPAAAFAQSFSALLTGAAEIPGPGDSDGTGMAVVRIDGTTLHYTVWTQNIGAATAAHIHQGAAGVAGDPVVTLDVNMLGNGAVTVSQEIASRIAANPAGYYVNVHTAEFPAGAIRGQLTGVAATAGVRTSYIPAIGKVTGANNTNFVTDVRILNTGAVTASVTLDYFAQGAAGHNAPTVSQVTTVAPGEQKVLNDVVATTLGLASGLGGLRISSDQPVIASARIINDLRAQNAGTAGFAVDAEAEAGMSGTLTFLSNDADFRTNLGYFNPTATPATATITARTTDGVVLGTTTITIPGFAMVQQPVFSLISTVPAGEQTKNDFYVTWSATAPLFVYASVTDNKTGDAVVSR